MIWVVKTNSNVCHIYEYQKHPMRLTLIKELFHPESRMKKSDYLTSDRPGHYQTSGSARGAYSPHTDPTEVEINHFAQEIAKNLNMGRNNHAYDELILIAAPHMEGVLLKHLDKHVAAVITHHLKKDLQHQTDKELLDFLRENTKYPEE